MGALKEGNSHVLNGAMPETDRIGGGSGLPGETSSSEQERYQTIYLRELDLGSKEDIQTYYRLLTDPANIEHFSNPPTDPDNLREKLIHDKTHAYLAESMLGEVVGAGGINDAAAGEHDHFLVKVVVDSKLQGRGIGRQLLVHLIEKGFSTRTDNGTERVKLDAAIIRDVSGWERMPHILQKLGFRPLHILLNQVDVIEQRTGRTVRKPTERWEISKADWMRMKRRKEISQILPPK